MFNFVVNWFKKVTPNKVDSTDPHIRNMVAACYNSNVRFIGFIQGNEILIHPISCEEGERLEKVEFVILEDKVTWQKLKCPKCSTEFEIDIHKELNLLFDKKTSFYIAQCPNCKVIEK